MRLLGGLCRTCALLLWATVSPPLRFRGRWHVAAASGRRPFLSHCRDCADVAFLGGHLVVALGLDLADPAFTAVH